SRTGEAKIAPLRKGVVCRFAFVGGLTRGKGMRELLEAAAALKDDGVRFELLIAGPRGGPDEPNWEEHVRLVGLEQDVSFVGIVTGAAKAELFASADCLVLPSHVEGLPIVILEAAAANLAVIATDVGSVGELLSIAERGGAVREICPLVPPRDAVALAEQMSRLALDGELRREMGGRLRDHVAAHFSADIQVERLTRLYASILSCGIEHRPIREAGPPDVGRRGPRPQSGPTILPSIRRPTAVRAVLAAELR
ncbi:MAG: glycosyltransferase, partial [Planctomycetes bacterium]|nr:glycosyltransferase [Planctomycetota bacterium]